MRVDELLAEIAEIGRDPVRGGYSRHVFDPAELRLREWFLRRSGDVGLTAGTDRNGNLWAWWGEPGPDAVLTGSHLDSVPGGGAYDGPLGVASALVAVWRLRRSGFTPSRPLAVVVFAEEEGSRFGLACLGSRLLTGQVRPETVRALTDSSGTTFTDAARAAGVDPDGIGRDDELLADAGCFVELHVEQGRALADLGRPVAVASSIMAHGRWRVSFTGEGNHAGTTPMDHRHDPCVAMAHAVLAVRELAVAHGGRGTVGRAEIVPGGTNVIASQASVWIDARAEDDASLASLVRQIADAAGRSAELEGCGIEITEESRSGLVTFDPALRDRAAAVLDDAPLLATGAGHDAGVLAARIPTAMLFVRNPSGVSHAPAEAAGAEDGELGARALELLLRELL